MNQEKNLLRLSIFASEFLAIAALLSTGDIATPVAALSIAGLLILTLLDRFLPRKKFLVGFFLVMILVTAFAMVRSQQYRPLEVGAHLSLLLHLAIFFLPDPERARRFRLAITFIITSLAASLSPEFLTGSMILLYFLSTFIALLMQFVFDFSSNTVRNLMRFGGSRIALFVFIGSTSFLAITAVVFPLIPRLNVSRMISGNTLGKLGFSGEVDLQGRADPNQASAVALRIEIPQADDQRERMLKESLLKARNLDSFDGRSWYTSPSRAYSGYGYPGPSDHGIVIQREQIDSAVLPVFYGGHVEEVVSPKSGINFLQRSTGNNFRLSGSSRARVTYRATLGDPKQISEDMRETPLSTHHHSGKDDSRFNRLINQVSQKVFKKEKTVRQKISAVENFFTNNGYEYSLEPLQEYTPSGFDRFQKFLSEEKKGHCELFATAAALLLRHEGVPTRLAAGFRIPQTHGNRFIIVHSADAHVWVEAWDGDNQRWIVFDPTPMENIPIWKTVYKEALSLRDDMESYWYRYIVGAEDLQVGSMLWGLLALAFSRQWIWVITAIGFVFLAFGLRKRHLRRIVHHFGFLPRPEIRVLAREIDRLERVPGERSTELGHLRQIYNELRFARPLEEVEFQARVSDARNRIDQIKSKSA